MIEKMVNENEIVRELVLQINSLNFNERQMVFLIYTLALGLENNNLLKDITDCINEHKDSVFITGNVDTEKSVTLIQ